MKKISVYINIEQPISGMDFYTIKLDDFTYIVTVKESELVPRALASLFTETKGLHDNEENCVRYTLNPLDNVS